MSAEFTRQFAQGSGAARMRRDMYGNFFFVGDDDGPNMRMMMQQNPNMPRPVSVVDVLKAGQVVMTGSVMKTIFPEDDAHYGFDIEGLGTVEVRLTA